MVLVRPRLDTNTHTARKEHSRTSFFLSPFFLHIYFESRSGSEEDALVRLPRGRGRAGAGDLGLPNDGTVGAVRLGKLAPAGRVEIPAMLGLGEAVVDRDGEVLGD